MVLLLSAGAVFAYRYGEGKRRMYGDVKHRQYGEHRDWSAASFRGGGSRNSAQNVYPDRPPRAALPNDYQPTSQRAAWLVNPATRNVRIALTALQYEPAYGPPVHITLHYIRERTHVTTVGRQWSCNYDSYLSVVDIGKLCIMRPNGVILYYEYTPGTEIVKRPHNSDDRLYFVTNSLFVIRRDNSYEEYDLCSRRLVALADERGHRLSFIRNGVGALQAIVDAAGLTSQVSWTGTCLGSVTDPLGRTCYLEYLADRLARVITTAGETNTFAYDNAQSVTAIVTPSENTSLTPQYGFGFNTYGVREYTALTIAAQEGYTCLYQWAASTGLPSRYDQAAHSGKHVLSPRALPEVEEWTPQVDTLCTRTDSDARGERKVRYYIQGNMVLAEDEWCQDAWQPRQRYYFTVDGFVDYAVAPLPGSDYRKTSYAYNADGVCTLITRSTSSAPTPKLVLERILSPAGDLLYEVNPRGTVTYSYADIVLPALLGQNNTQRFLAAQCDENGFASFYAYDGIGRLASVRHAARPAALGTELVTNATAVINGTPYSYHLGQQSCLVPTISAEPHADDRSIFLVYGAEGYLLTTTNADGTVCHFTHDAVGRLVASTTPGQGGWCITNVYDSDDRPLNVRDSRAGLSRDCGYNALGLIALTNAAGETCDFSPDFAGRITRVAAPVGDLAINVYPPQPVAPALLSADAWGTSSFCYANNFSPTLIVHPDGAEETFGYDTAERLAWRTSPLGDRVTFAYDALDQLTGVFHKAGDTQSSRAYDAAGRLTCISDANGLCLSNIFNGNNLIAVMASDAGTSSFGYTAFGELAWLCNGMDYVISNSYDHSGFLTSSVDSLGRTISRTRYGASDQPAAQTDARGYTTSFSYDAALNNTSMTLPDAGVLTMAHDPMGRVLTTSYGSAQSAYAYDALGRLTAVEARSGVNSVAASYFSYRAGQPKPDALTTYYSAAGTPSARVVSNAYEACGRLCGVTDPAGNSVALAYNGIGQITNIIAPAGHCASFEYDEGGRLIAETDFHGRHSTVSHDVNARVTTVTRPDASTITTLNDTQGRPTSVFSQGNGGRTNTLAFRLDGTLSSGLALYGADSICDDFARNAAGELISRTSTYSMAGATVFIMNYLRDAGALVTNLSSDLEGFSARSFVRDGAGRITAMDAAGFDSPATFSYDANGRMASSSATAAQLLYDPLGRATSITSPACEITNAYDTCAPARMLWQSLRDANRTNDHYYSYDLLDQVCAETLFVNGTQAWYNVYAYDGFGDIITCRNDAVSYSGGSAITRGSGASAVTYRFDARGNCTNAAAASTPRFFSYDSDNNIIAASVGPTNWTFRYNAQNQMAYSKLQVNSATADERCYLYDGLDCIAEVSPAGEVYREFIRAGVIGGVVAEIIHNDLTVPAQYRNATFFYQYNHRGDVIAVTDDAGTLVWQCDYDAFGLPLTLDPAPLTPRFSFSTKRYFAELGTYYYGYRWYLPELCRWMQPDPIGIADSINQYLVCANNAMVYVDVCDYPQKLDKHIRWIAVV
jgi:RHS repeat-associated protein